MVQTLKILTDAYRSRIVDGQSTLKDVIERYFWNGLSRERLKVMKALYALYALYAKYANVLKNIHLLKKVKSEIWNQTAYTLGVYWTINFFFNDFLNNFLKKFKLNKRAALCKQ